MDALKGNKTVAIPCNASVAFVALVTSKSSDEQSEIPGNFSLFLYFTASFSRIFFSSKDRQSKNVVATHRDIAIGH